MVVRSMLLLVGALLASPAAQAGPPRPITRPAAATAPPVRKPATAAYSADALALFVDAIVADKAGDLETAQRRYLDANRRSPQAATYYNLADVQRRMERLDRALESYRKYLELAPEAPDRAAVARLVERLATGPGTVVIDGDDLDAIVFLNGRRLGPSPVVLELPPGRYAADRLGPKTHARWQFEVRSAKTAHLDAGSRGEREGNVVISASAIGFDGGWEDDGVRFELGRRFTLAPGRYQTYLVARGRTCTPLAFEVPRAAGVTYVYVDAGAPAAPGDCLPIQVRTQQVRFAP